MRQRALVLDSDPTFGHSLLEDFSIHDFDVEIVNTPAEAIATVAASPPALVVLDVHLADGAALQLLRLWQREAPDLLVIVVSSTASLNVVISALKEGARRFFAKPVSVAAILDELSQREQARLENAERHELGSTALDPDGVDRFFAISPGLLSIAGFDGYFKMLNPAWTKALGYTVDELCAQPYLELVHPDDREKARDEAFDMRGGHTVFIFKNRYRRKDGQYRWLEWHATPSIAHRLVYASARDVTSTVRTEEWLRDANAQLKGSVASYLLQLHDSAERNDQLVELGRARNEVSSMLVHDLKNPLAVIIANYDYLVEGFEGSAECLQALQDSSTAGRRMLRLLENIVDVERLENGTLVIHTTPLDLRALVEDLVDQRRLLAATRNLTIALLPGPPCRAAIDADLVKRVVENIFDNAFRHTPKGGSIEVSLEPEGPCIELRIGNTGPAVSADLREAIFEKNSTSNTDAARLNLGLGLYFCRLVAEAHGGTMWVEETPRLPTLFGIRMPLLPATPQPES